MTSSMQLESPLLTISMDTHGEAVRARMRALSVVKQPLLRYQLEMNLLLEALLDGMLTFTPASVWRAVCQATDTMPPDDQVPEWYAKFNDYRVVMDTYVALLGSLTELALGYEPAKPSDVTFQHAQDHHSDGFHGPRLDELMVSLQALLKGYIFQEDAILRGSDRLYETMQRHFAKRWLTDPIALGTALMTHPEYSRVLNFGKHMDMNETPGIRLVVWALERAIAEHDAVEETTDISEHDTTVMFFWKLLKGICWDIAFNNGNAWQLAKDSELHDRIDASLRRGLEIALHANELQQHLPPHHQLGWGSTQADNGPATQAAKAYTEEIISGLRQRYATTIQEQAELAEMNKLFS